MTDTYASYALVFLAAYLIGSIPFGLILTKLAGLGDIRAIGSGNIGATNVLRTGNKKLAALTLLLDGLKGFVVVCLFKDGVTDCINMDCLEPIGFTPPLITKGEVAAIASLLGHIFPIWLKCKGGKGVATYIGAAFGLLPTLGLAACSAWLLTALLSRISSLSALVMLVVVPLLAFIILPSFLLPLALMSLLVIYRHKDNIKRLLNGTEPKIGKK